MNADVGGGGGGSVNPVQRKVPLMDVGTAPVKVPVQGAEARK